MKRLLCFALLLTALYRMAVPASVEPISNSMTWASRIGAPVLLGVLTFQLHRSRKYLLIPVMTMAGALVLLTVTGLWAWKRWDFSSSIYVVKNCIVSSGYWSWVLVFVVAQVIASGLAATKANASRRASRNRDAKS